MLKKILVPVIILLLYQVFGSMNTFSESDIYPPILHDITVEKSNYVPLETIRIEASITDEGGSGISSVYIRYKKPITQTLKLVSLVPENGKYVGYIKISEYEEGGTWQIYSVALTDLVGNLSYVYQASSTNPLQPLIDLSSASFNLENENSDVVPPILTAIQVEHTTYFPGDTVRIEADVTDTDGSGVRTVYLRYQKPLSQDMRLVHLYPENGKYVGYITLTEDDEKGLWQIFSITLFDTIGNMSYVYQNSSTNPLQPLIDLSSASFNLENENSDVSPPILNTIEVDQATYFPGDAVRIEADVTDGEGSGVAMVYLRYLKPLSQEMRLVHLYPENGKYVGYIDLSIFDEKGIWEIYSITMFDVSGNMSYVYQETSTNPLQPSIDLSSATFELKEPDITPPFIRVNLEDYSLVQAGFILTVYIEDDVAVLDQSIRLSDFSGIKTIGNETVLEEGVFELLVYAIDTAGNESNLTLNFVVYDGESGFVTGGGWINSPEGALKDSPNLYGKARFGFVSKYQKGAKVPSGNTTFKFEIGNFSFNSSSYDWLVVAGKRAQFKGDGEINDVPGYMFMLTAEDALTDRFRIKIWEKLSGEIIYDNQIDTRDIDELYTEGTVVQEGNIKIHK